MSVSVAEGKRSDRFPFGEACPELDAASGKVGWGDLQNAPGQEAGVSLDRAVRGGAGAPHPTLPRSASRRSTPDPVENAGSRSLERWIFIRTHIRRRCGSSSTPEA